MGYIYLLIFSYMLFFINNRKIVCYIYLFTFTLFWGLRYDVGRDYLTYELMFSEGNSTEILYRSLENIVKFFYLDFHYLTLIISFLTFLPIIVYFLNSEYKLKEIKLGLILFLLLGFPLSYANLMRQGVSITLFFLAINLDLKKNKKMAIVLFFISICFHKSSIIAIIIYFFIKKIKFSKKISLALIWIIYILKFRFSFTDILLKFEIIIKRIYPIYTLEILKSYEVKSFKSLNLAILFYIIIYTIILLKKSKVNLNQIEKLYFLALIFKILSTQNFIFNRFGYYFDLFFIPLFLNYFNITKNRILKSLFLIIFFVIYLKSSLIYSDEDKIYYQTIYNKKESERLIEK